MELERDVSGPGAASAQVSGGRAVTIASMQLPRPG
jgi:hypothetical protein